VTDKPREPARIVFWHENEATVQAIGEIDTSTSPLLGACLAECIHRGCTRVTIDMSQLEFIDSSGIQVLVWLLKELRALDGELVISNPPGMAEKVLAISGLTPYLTMRGTRNDEPVDPA
jgi:anti-anti-sigma factor